MPITAVLRELFAHKTQTVIASELTLLGLTVDQTKVSAWMRSRQPSLDEVAVIERWAGKPRGWVLARAGYVDMADVVAVTRLDVGPSAEQQAQVVELLSQNVTRLSAQVGEQGDEIAALLLAFAGLRAQLDRLPPPSDVAKQ